MTDDLTYYLADLAVISKSLKEISITLKKIEKALNQDKDKKD